MSDQFGKLGENINWNSLDDKTKKKIDGYFVSSTEKYEVAYQLGKLKKEFPKKNEDEILQALNSCFKAGPKNHPRAQLEECVRGKLK